MNYFDSEIFIGCGHEHLHLGPGPGQQDQGELHPRRPLDRHPGARQPQGKGSDRLIGIPG